MMRSHNMMRSARNGEWYCVYIRIYMFGMDVMLSDSCSYSFFWMIVGYIHISFYITLLIRTPDNFSHIQSIHTHPTKSYYYHNIYTTLNRKRINRPQDTQRKTTGTSWKAHTKKRNHIFLLRCTTSSSSSSSSSHHDLLGLRSLWQP